MLDRLVRHPGDSLALDSYIQDFDLRFGALRDADVLKVERIQDFHQPENASWMKYLSGETNEALRMLEDDRPDLLEIFGDLADRGGRVLRVRVVERPITPYVYWELHSLHIRDQCGENIRVIGPEAVAHLENHGLVPEVVTLADEVTYRIRYTAEGVLEGAERYLDSEVTQACAGQIHSLYQEAEPLAPFFLREIAPLEAPCA